MIHVLKVKKKKKIIEFGIGGEGWAMLERLFEYWIKRNIDSILVSLFASQEIFLFHLSLFRTTIKYMMGWLIDWNNISTFGSYMYTCIVSYLRTFFWLVSISIWMCIVCDCIVGQLSIDIYWEHANILV